jgi:hypothetical protein
MLFSSDPKLEGNSGGTWVGVWEDMQDGGGYRHRRPMLNTKIMIWARASAIAQELTRGRRAACRSWHLAQGSREGVLRSGEQDMQACKGKSKSAGVGLVRMTLFYLDFGQKQTGLKPITTLKDCKPPWLRFHELATF